jgi:hypothetical protein
LHFSLLGLKNAINCQFLLFIKTAQLIYYVSSLIMPSPSRSAQVPLQLPESRRYRDGVVQQFVYHHVYSTSSSSTATNSLALLWQKPANPLQ